MSAEANKALVRRFFEAQVEGDLGAMREAMADDFVDHSVLPGQDPGREGYLRLEAQDQASFSGIRRVIEDQVADGDKVITRLTVSGTHDLGHFVGAAPSGTEMFFTAIVIHRVSGGEIVEEWSESGGMQEITQLRLEQEIRERARVEQELQVARRIQHALLPKALPTTSGLGHSTSLQARAGGRRRLLRLPRATRRPPWTGRGGRHRPRHPCGAGNGQHAERPSCRRPKWRFRAWAYVGRG